MDRWITDAGNPIEFVVTTLDGKKLPSERLPRYGVWEVSPMRGKAEVVEVSDDLEAMQNKYGPGLIVHRWK